MPRFWGHFASGVLAQTDITFGHVGGPTSLFNVSAEHFAELANERLISTYVPAVPLVLVEFFYR